MTTDHERVKKAEDSIHSAIHELLDIEDDRFIDAISTTLETALGGLIRWRGEHPDPDDGEGVTA